MSTEWLDLPCIECGRSMGAAEADGPNTLLCACGVRYSEELVKNHDHDRWHQILARDGFEVRRDGSALWVTEYAPPAP